MAEVSGCLRKQLAVMVRSIGWSYAIYWCHDSDQPPPRGRRVVLEWRDGYYNGTIRTTHPPVLDRPIRTAQRGLRRTAQLRELYDWLSAAGARPSSSPSLSPDDLTNTEWYFLVCMSFTFADGQCLPGRTLSCGREVWLFNAQFADSRIFSRSLLAKSASIQTIVCVPFGGGVLELGTTEHVFEKQDLIKHMTSPFSGPSASVSSGPSKPSARGAEVGEEEGQVAPSSVVDIGKDTPCAMHLDENLILSKVAPNRSVLSRNDRGGSIWFENVQWRPGETTA